MREELRGRTGGKGRRVAVVVSRYNDLVTAKLAEGAKKSLLEAGVAEDDLAVVWVPGAWEIPLAARSLAVSGRWNGVVALGTVIQGETTHHEHLGREVAASLMRLSDETGVPVAFGVLTTDSLEKALERAGGRVGNKGSECALHLLEMLDVLEKIKKHS